MKRLYILVAFTLVVGCMTLSHDESSSRIPDKLTKTKDHYDSPIKIRHRAYLAQTVDSSGMLSSDILARIHDLWKFQLEKQQSLILHSHQNSDQDRRSDSNLEQIISELNRQGVRFFLKPEIMDVKIHKRLKPRGIIRNQTTETMIQMKLAVFNTRTKNKELEKIRTMTFEDSEVRISGDQLNYKLDEFLEKYQEKILEHINELILDFQDDLAQILKRTEWEGRIALIQGDRVYLNVGEISGVRIG
ncbi:MAG: hypothetical protein NZ480_00625, partial [Bdellovibrionaceae bacterium]|nr:hypothetical protein [Pseudobdellovibrionaceae bacterium]